MPKILRGILSQWLKSEISYQGQSETNLTGFPQGSVIGPSLANYSLNGLENCIKPSQATAIDEDILLEVLRNFLKKPETPKAQQLFKINKEMILKATVSAEGDTKEALTMMQRLFEREIAKGELE